MRGAPARSTVRGLALIRSSRLRSCRATSASPSVVPTNGKPAALPGELPGAYRTAIGTRRVPAAAQLPGAIRFAPQPGRAASASLARLQAYASPVSPQTRPPGDVARSPLPSPPLPWSGGSSSCARRSVMRFAPILFIAGALRQRRSRRHPRHGRRPRTSRRHAAAARVRIAIAVGVPAACREHFSGSVLDPNARALQAGESHQPNKRWPRSRRNLRFLRHRAATPVSPFRTQRRRNVSRHHQGSDSR
jgi:hypothetical protein